MNKKSKSIRTDRHSIKIIILRIEVRGDEAISVILSLLLITYRRDRMTLTALLASLRKHLK